ncbi:MAG: hypothetical protein JXQ84_07740 [Rhodospirillaceae bacterium]|nr:hypothetical protein [Rhodospirillaceae bacterium]
MTHFDPKTVWVFARGRKEYIASPIAGRVLNGRHIIILRDTEDGLWIAQWTADGGNVLKGPVTLAQALDAAEGVVCGAPDHGSVAALTTTLALGLVAVNALSHPADDRVPVYGTHPVKTSPVQEVRP